VSYRTWHAVAGNIAHSPLHGGVKVFHPTKREMGTIGCVVTRAGKPYLLSNQHVFGVATEGKPIFDSNNKAQIAQVSYTGSVAPTNDYVDAALAAPTLPVSFEIPGVGIPRGHTEPKIGMKVKMFAGFSGFKTGVVTAVNKELTDSKGKRGVFLINIPIQGGDSGTLVVDSNNMAVGLVFGDNAATGEGTCCKASAIIRAYPGLSFVGKAGPSIQPIPPAINEPRVIQAGFDIKQEHIVLGVGALLGLFLLTRR
jgi:hypothetical protein